MVVAEGTNKDAQDRHDGNDAGPKPEPFQDPILSILYIPIKQPLTKVGSETMLDEEWGRTGFDWVDTLGVACRGWYVGLVNHRTKQ